jgi:hypothetical protein
LVVSGGKFLPDRSGVGHARRVVAGVGAGSLTRGAPATGAAVLDDALASVEALLADSLESAVQEKNASIAIRLTVAAAIDNILTPHLANFF